MKKSNILFGLLMGFGLLLGSCVDELEQITVTETTSDEEYTQSEN